MKFNVLAIFLLLLTTYCWSTEATILNEALLDACWKGDLVKIKDLVEKGADVNCKDKYGFTPLMWASGKGYYEIVEYLLSKNANLNDKDTDGWTAIMKANINKHDKVVELLKSKGAELPIEQSYPSSSVKNQYEESSDNSSSNSSYKSNRSTSSVQCRGITKKGRQCRRMTRSPNGYCWQHGGN